jgi:hypothetical protein
VSYWGCWCLVQYTRSIHHPIPFLNNHLTDFVFIPIISHFALECHKTICPDTPLKRIPLFYLLIIAAYVSVVYELILPVAGFQTRADFMDVIAYHLGAIFYYRIHQKWACKT